MKRTLRFLPLLLLLLLPLDTACHASRSTLSSRPRTSSDTLRVSILGDSYSTFEGYLTPDTNSVWYHPAPRNKTDVITAAQTWWSLFLASGAYRLELNNSYSGSTICHTGYRGDDYKDRSFVTRMDHLGQPDIILIFGATNDSWANAPIGEYPDATPTEADLYAFRPALAHLLDGLRRLYPHARLYFMLNTGLKEEINNSVHTLCARYAVPCIDLHDIDKQKGHPSAAGMAAIAAQLNSYFAQSQEK